MITALNSFAVNHEYEKSVERERVQVKIFYKFQVIPLLEMLIFTEIWTKNVSFKMM